MFDKNMANNKLNGILKVTKMMTMLIKDTKIWAKWLLVCVWKAVLKNKKLTNSMYWVLMINLAW